MGSGPLLELSTLIFSVVCIRPLLELPTLIFADVRIKKGGGGGGVGAPDPSLSFQGMGFEMVRLSGPTMSYSIPQMSIIVLY